MRITAVSKDRGRESECFNASTPPPSEPDLRRKGGPGQIYDSPTSNAVSLPPRSAKALQPSNLIS